MHWNRLFVQVIILELISLFFKACFYQKSQFKVIDGVSIKNDSTFGSFKKIY